MVRKYLQRPNPENYLTVKEISSLTGFHANTIYNWFKDKIISYEKGIKGKYLVKQKDLRKFIKKYYDIDLSEL